jgi:hypothetical protein
MHSLDLIIESTNLISSQPSMMPLLLAALVVH